MEVGDQTSVGNQSLHTISLFFLVAFTWGVGYPTEAGYLVSRVTRLAGVTFFSMWKPKVG